MPFPSDPRERPIAVFDSGVGGLTVLHELLVRLPNEDFVYLGDTARFPYGDRGPDELRHFSLQIAEELLARGAKLLVVACNSATAAALPALRRRMLETTLGVDVLGVVGPEAVHAVTATRNGRIGLLATTATVASGAYETAVARRRPARRPDRGRGARPRADDPGRLPVRRARRRGRARVCRAARRGAGRHRDPGLHALPAGAPDAPADARSRRARSSPPARRWRARSSTRSARAGSAARATGEGAYSFLSTGDPETFRTLGTRFLQLPLGDVEQVRLHAELAA